MRLVCGLVLVLGGFQLTCALLVGAWNIQIFGPKKASKPEVMAQIAEVVSHYDVVVIQEVREKSDELPYINKLMEEKLLLGYEKEVSKPLGTSKERYLYIYKTNTVQFIDDYQYPDPNNKFSRPPYVALFKAVTESFDFVMIPLHAIPESGKTLLEINALADVVADVVKEKPAWNTQNILLLGDFNAGGAYLPKKDKDKLTLPDNCQWLIGDNARTTVKTNYPYDRIVATDYMIQHHVVATTAMPYDFQTALNLSQDKALAVSDHFPVEVQLKKKD